MTESQYTSELVAYLKNAGCVVFKHSDHFTTGIPDLSVTTRGHTTWFEVKVLKHGETFTKRVMQDRVQFFSVLLLGNAGRAFYLIRDGKELWIFHPRFLKELDDLIVDDEQRREYLLTHRVIFPVISPTTEILKHSPVVTDANNFQLVLQLSQVVI